MEPFQYKKLNDSTTEIRLLRLLPNPDPADESCPIKARLYTFRVHKCCPSFAAVSYRWGVSPTTVAITINNAVLPVRSTVHDLLVQLRASRVRCPRQPHFLWIDSVCINQADVDERNHQVKLMRNVYSSAEVVFVWLGGAADGSDEAMEYLRGLRRCELGRTGRRAIGQLAIREDRRERVQTQRMYYGDPAVQGTFRDATRDAVIRLLQREYWSRMWIVQEILLARKIVVLCGAKRTAWHRLENLFGAVKYHVTRSPARFFFWSSGAMKTQAYRLVTARAYFEASGNPASVGLPFMELWEVFFTGQCTDVRDKVYGLLGLSRDEIEIDYRKGAQEIYDDVAAYMGRVYERDARDSGLRLLARHLGVDSRLGTAKSEPAVFTLDEPSLAQLGHHFDNVMEHISQEMSELTEECNTVTMETYDTSGQIIDNVDAEIARFQRIMQRIDDLELDFDHITQIRDIVRGYRVQWEELEASLEKGTAGG